MLHWTCIVAVVVAHFDLSATALPSKGRPGNDDVCGADDAVNVTVTCDNANHLSTDTSSGDSGFGRRQTIDIGMAPLYAATNFFLENILWPRSVAALRLKVDLSDPKRIYESVRYDSSMWARHHIGFTMMVVAGILWAALMPVIGCVIIFWCSGGKRRRRSYRSRHCCRCASYKNCCRRTLAVFLGISCVGLLISVAVMMLANQLMCELTLGGGLVNRFVIAVRRLERYRNKMTVDIQTAVEDSVELGQQKIITEVNSIAHTCQQKLDEISGLPDILDELFTLVQSLNETAHLYSDLRQTSEAMYRHMNDATRNMSALRNDIRFNLKLCANVLESCKTSLRNVNRLTIDIPSGNNILFGSTADVTGDLADRSRKLQAQIYIDEHAYTSFVKANFANQRYDMAVEALKTRARNLSAVIRRVVRNLNKRVDIMFPLTSYKDWVTTTLAPWLSRYGSYRSGVGIAVCAVALLPATGCLIALQFGAWGATRVDAVLEPVPCCTRTKATSALLVTAATTLETGWLLALATCLLFLVGGSMHVDLCRHLVSPSVDPDSASVAYDTVGQWLNMSVDLRMVMYACAKCQNVLKIFDLTFVPEEIISMERLTGPLRNLRQAIVSYPSKGVSFNVLNSDMIGVLEHISTSIASFDIATYRYQLGQIPGAQTLVALADTIRETAAVVQASGDSAIANSLANYSQEVSRRYAAYVTAVERYHKNLNVTVDKLEASICSINITSLISRVRFVQALNETDAMRRAVDATADDVRQTFIDVVNDVRAAVLKERDGGCRPVYDAIGDAFAAVCVDYLYPFNAFWFVAGVCCFILLPWTVTFAVALRQCYCMQEIARTSHRISLKHIRMGRPQRQTKRPSLPQEQCSIRSAFIGSQPF